MYPFFSTGSSRFIELHLIRFNQISIAFMDVRSLRLKINPHLFAVIIQLNCIINLLNSALELYNRTNRFLNKEIEINKRHFLIS